VGVGTAAPCTSALAIKSGRCNHVARSILAENGVASVLPINSACPGDDAATRVCRLTSFEQVKATCNRHNSVSRPTRPAPDGASGSLAIPQATSGSRQSRKVGAPR
jgi:hypothetical protein